MSTARTRRRESVCGYLTICAFWKRETPRSGFTLETNGTAYALHACVCVHVRQGGVSPHQTVRIDITIHVTYDTGHTTVHMSKGHTLDASLHVPSYIPVSARVPEHWPPEHWPPEHWLRIHLHSNLHEVRISTSRLDVCPSFRYMTRPLRSRELRSRRRPPWPSRWCARCRHRCARAT